VVTLDHLKFQVVILENSKFQVVILDHLKIQVVILDHLKSLVVIVDHSKFQLGIEKNEKSNLQFSDAETAQGNLITHHHVGVAGTDGSIARARRARAGAQLAIFNFWSRFVNKPKKQRCE